MLARNINDIVDIGDRVNRALDISEGMARKRQDKTQELTF